MSTYFDSTSFGCDLALKQTRDCGLEDLGPVMHQCMLACKLDLFRLEIALLQAWLVSVSS